MDRWWDDRPDEIYWLKTTDRPDLGVDLKAPQTNERGEEFWSYAAVREVRDGSSTTTVLDFGGRGDQHSGTLDGFVE
jgi:hypothetical protein